MEMEQEVFKKVKFGGYDTEQVDMYIAQLNQKHINDINGLKETIAKLSDTVRNLQAMRESNTSESKQTVDTLKKSDLSGKSVRPTRKRLRILRRSQIPFQRSLSIQETEPMRCLQRQRIRQLLSGLRLKKRLRH